jgi:nucleoid DNA-binding protein
MFQSTEIILALDKPLLWVAQVPLAPPVSPAQASVITSGPRFFVALLSGVILAFAFQLVLTNLSVAAGISYLGRPSDSGMGEGGSFGGTIRKIGTAAGIWTLVTVTIALLIACFLAVKLSLLVLDPRLGAILGLVIWGAYFLLLVWVSSTTVGSLIGSVVHSATSGFQAIMGTATAALGAKAVNQQVVATAEAAASAVRRELGSAIDPISIRENIEDYIEKLRPPELDISHIRGEFESLLSDPQLREIAGSPDLRHIDRQKFVDLVSSRTDLSKRDVNRIADTLYSVWRQTMGKTQPTQDNLGELVSYLKSLPPGQTKTDELNAKLDRLMAQIGTTKETEQKAAPGPIQSTLQQGLSALTGIVLGRTDLSDLDVEKIWQALTTAKDKATAQADKLGLPIPSQPYSPIRADIENYLLNTYAWQLSEERIAQEFRDVIYDPAADPGTVRRELERISHSDFVNILQSRGLLTQAQIQHIADRLEAVRQEVLLLVTAEEEREIAQDLQRRVESYLLVTAKADLTPEAIERDFKSILADPDADYETMSRRLVIVERQAMLDILLERNDIQPYEAGAIVDELEKQRDRALVESKNLADQARYQAETLWLNVESYLRNTGKAELNPDAIRADLKRLLEDPQAGMTAIRARLSRFDRDTLVKLLSQRQDLSEEQVNQVIDSVQTSIRNIVRAPRRLATRTQQRVETFQAYLEEYLRQTGKEELNPEGIKRDVQLLLHDPRVGMESLSDRLAHFDRATIIALLKIREDISDQEAARIADNMISVRDQFVEQVRGIQRRIQDVIDGIFERIRHYLNSLERPELNYDGIKHDVRTLLEDPQAGFDALRDRLSSFNRDTLVAIMSSREDISEAEANRVIDQIERARNTVLQRAERLQQQAQHRLEEMKYQAQRQAEETRKAAASAAWWLFATAIVSALFSALGGAIAVVLV